MIVKLNTTMQTKGKLITIIGIYVGYKIWNIEQRAKLKYSLNRISMPERKTKNAIVVGAGVAGVSAAALAPGSCMPW